MDSFFTELWSLSYPGFTINMLDIAYIMQLEYCCSPIFFVIGRGLCIAMQYSQNACFPSSYGGSNRGGGCNIAFELVNPSPPTPLFR